MAREFEVLGWKDFDGVTHKGPPFEPDSAMGLLVHVLDHEKRDHEYFWAYQPGPIFDNWQDWYDHISNLIGDYGIEL